MIKKRAVVLLSGGLDSTTCLALAKADGFNPVCLSVDYGQRHAVELQRAKASAAANGVEHHIIVKLDMRAIGGSALTSEVAVPKHDDVSQVRAEIPVTYVPARNLILLSLATSLAEVVGARDIYIGVNAVDYSGYPDCRPEFMEKFEDVAKLATKVGVEGNALTIHRPLIGLTKKEIIERGLAAGVDYSFTHSCYDPVKSGDNAGLACGKCDSCLIRLKGFADAGVVDPVLYV